MVVVEKTSAGQEGGVAGSGGLKVVMRACWRRELLEEEEVVVVEPRLRGLAGLRSLAWDAAGTLEILREVRPPPGAMVLAGGVSWR